MESIEATLVRLSSGATPWKLPARVVATSSIDFAGLDTIDGVALAEGDRVLVANGSATTNGLWVATAGPWYRPVDFATSIFVKLGTIVPVIAGTSNRLSIWMMSAPSTGSVTLGATALTFTKIVQAP